MIEKCFKFSYGNEISQSCNVYGFIQNNIILYKKYETIYIKLILLSHLFTFQTHV